MTDEEINRKFDVVAEHLAYLAEAQAARILTVMIR